MCEDVIPVRIRRHDKKQHGTQVDDIEKIIAVVFAVSTAYYMDRKPMFRASCGSILINVEDFVAASATRILNSLGV
jgi:hypothetical protein